MKMQQICNGNLYHNGLAPLKQQYLISPDIRVRGNVQPLELLAKPYVHEEHNCTSLLSGKEFYDYFRGAGTETHK